MIKFVLLVLFLVGVYWVIPFILTAGAGIGVLKRKATSDKIAFTFDDGPNPVYTPQLLDLLKKHNIKATFFVVGSKAEKYPELIARMHAEGHLIGIHNYVHKSNWVMAPWTTLRHLNKTASIIERITGERPIYYRPPWGLLTLLDFLLLKQYQIIHWSVMAEDWRSRGGSEKVEKRLLQTIKNGDVVLLHDCGETAGADVDAPKNTIHALINVFKELSNQSLACVRLDEL
ncbi:polysaccharide deacetylase family protein [Neobacillus drentensis]|uniref:polysaccharide deacetylase family protein n=1 Tax=Neobacillus drentensis TaxID=220684 RepID=UPI001F334BFD|nr:polysaccharide deacetylase family protein [Neobacillus drentensis]ULT54471.1 polysaccharide deacetylase family protein [Neobacillus drentensis]